MQVCMYDYVTYLYFFGFRTFTADALQPETCFPYALCGKTVIKVALTLNPVCGGGGLSPIDYASFKYKCIVQVRKTLNLRKWLSYFSSKVSAISLPCGWDGWIPLLNQSC